MVVSIITISIIAVAAVALVIVGGVYVYRSYRSRRQAKNQDKKSHKQRKLDKIVEEESKRQLNVKHDDSSSKTDALNESNSTSVNEDTKARTISTITAHNQSTDAVTEEVKSPEESKLNQIKEIINECMLESSPISNFDRFGRRIPVIDGRHIRAYPSVGDENVEPVGNSKQSYGTMSSGSFGNESVKASPDSCGKIGSDGTKLVRRSRIPRKIRDIEPDPRDEQRYKLENNSSAPAPSPGVSPAISMPSPISAKSRDTPTISPLTSSSSGVGRSAFNAKEVED